jgi:hypothetical protein
LGALRFGPLATAGAIMTGKLPSENLRRGGGRPKGAPNKTTALLKDAIIKAAETANTPSGKRGLVEYLSWLAVDHPPSFASLLGKVLPLQVTGPNDGTLKVEFVTVYEDKP